MSLQIDEWCMYQLLLAFRISTSGICIDVLMWARASIYYSANMIIIVTVPDMLSCSLCFQVHSHVDVYNFTSNTWTERFDMPKEMAHSHLGMVSDGRYVYAVSGQYGPQCRASINRNFVLDTQTKKWSELPPLPLPRYIWLNLLTITCSELLHWCLCASYFIVLCFYQ